MEKTVLIVNGNPGSGKTTVENLISQWVPSMIHSSVKVVKDIDLKYFDGRDYKTEESRKFLSDMKHFLLAETSIIEDDLNSKYEEFGYSKNEILMIDMREKNEIIKYKKKFDAITLFINNPRTNILLSNKSDSQVNEINYDFVIENDGDIHDLEIKVLQFLKQLRIRMIPQLYFQNSKGFYYRYWLEVNGDIMIDVASHSEFFVIKDGIKLFPTP